jgi:type I restriction enzyme S subunit
LLPPLPEQRRIASVLPDIDEHLTALEKLIAKKRNIKQGAMQELLTGKRRLSGFSEEWVEKTIEDITNIYDNLRLPVTESKRTIGITPYYGANGIQGYISGHTHNGDYILIAEDGANDIKNYPIFYVSGKIWVNNHTHVLQGNGIDITTEYLAVAMKNVDYQSILVGGTRAKLNGGVLKKIRIIIPPTIAEQTAIAKILSDMDAEIDALTAKLKKIKHIKQGMMTELLTGRIRLPEQKTIAVSKIKTGELQKQKPAAEKKKPSANVHFRRSVWAAEIVDRLYDEPSRG